MLPKELNFYFAACLLAFLALVVFVWKRISENDRSAVFYVFIGLVFIFVALFALKLPNRLEAHPPMRLLPLFLGHIYSN